MLTDIKYLKKHKTCMFVKKVRSWECRIYDVEICVFTSRWCHFGCGDLLSYLDVCIMPCVLDARLALLSVWGCGVCIF